MKKILFLLLGILLLSGISALSVSAKARTETVTYSVNMHCQNCVNKLSDNLSFLKGVKDLRISLKDKTVTIKYDPSRIDEEELVRQIGRLGYTAEKVDTKNGNTFGKKIQQCSK